jgi:hypothetical protein
MARLSALNAIAIAEGRTPPHAVNTVPLNDPVRKSLAGA